MVKVNILVDEENKKTLWTERSIDEVKEMLENSSCGLFVTPKVVGNTIDIVTSNYAQRFGVATNIVFQELNSLPWGGTNPRVLNMPLKNGVVLTTEMDPEDGSYTYSALLNDNPIYKFKIGTQRDAENAISLLTICTESGDVLRNFIESVTSDFPVDEPSTAKPEVEEKRPLPESAARKVVEKKEAMKELGVILCQLGGPQIELVIKSPFAHRINRDSFLGTIKMYLAKGGQVLEGDMGRTVILIGPTQLGSYEEIIRSALVDHNVHDGCEIDREEYHLGKEIPGRIYL